MMTRSQGARRLRSVLLSVAAAVMVTSVSGCGAVHSALGIHEAPEADQASVPLTDEHAVKILRRTFAAVRQGETLTGAPGAAARKTAYTGEGLRAAHARVKLAGVRPAVGGSPLLAPERPRLLAVSRGFGFPRFIVAQTEALPGAVPVLHLLTSPNAATPYRISGSAEMLPLAKVKPFDPISQGSALVGSGTAVAVAPAALLSRYAAAMAYPAKPVSALPFAADSFSGQLRDQAAGVAKAVSPQATFSQVHKVVPGSVYAVRQAGGDVLVFGVIERTDRFVVKSGEAVNTASNKAFVLLTGKRKVAKAASITTLELVVFAVPGSKGDARLVAAREQVVAGSGS